MKNIVSIEENNLKGDYMTYEEARSYVDSRMKFGIKPGLERIRKLLNSMENPQDNLKYVHVSGTNGKGSVCTMMSAVLQKAGYKVGLFTSPFVIDFRERFKINSIMISKVEFTNTVNKLKPFVDEMENHGEHVTEFELITAIAFQWFSDQNCDIVVLEVGLGGTFDSTNIIKKPLISIITSISMDHVAVLGNSLKNIAENKAGIIKHNSVTVICPEQKDEVMSVIDRQVLLKNNKKIVPEVSMLNISFESIDGSWFTYKEKKYYLSLIGTHQIKNAITVIAALEQLKDMGFKIKYSHILEAFRNVRFASRMEVFSKKPLVVVDGAHNVGGALALSNALKKNLKGRNIIAITSMMADKDVDEVMSIIVPLCNKLIVTKASNPRAMSGPELYKIVKNYSENVILENDLKKAVDLAFRNVNKNDVILSFGSLYLSCEIRPLFIEILN